METDESNPQVANNLIPKEGMQFTSIEEAFEFYNSYAKVTGFSTRRSSTKRAKHGDKEINWQQFLCYKEGEHSGSVTIVDGERNRGTVRTGCKARMTVSKKKNVTNFLVSQFVEGHNHPLATPRKSYLLPSHRSVSKAKKVLSQQFSEANIPTSQQHRLLGIQSGGFENIGCTERDLRNHIRNQREEEKGNDAVNLLQFFNWQKVKNPSFYFGFDKDEDDRLTRCFWADPEARRAYLYFGDVVVFDTTYNTNCYSMIFAPLMGVNQHGQTIIFGCGFLSDETTESFVWFFQQFMNSMLKGPPKMIITDQDPAMTNAIQLVLPMTFHRYCIWHIMNKFSDKLGGLLFSEYYQFFQASVYNSDTIEEFEHSWHYALEKSALHDHAWMILIYSLRQKWVPAYVKHIFSAGCSSSQRAESGHAFFKKYVLKNHTLVEFLTRFNIALEYQREQELRADWTNINEKPKLKSRFRMEKQMSEIYTKKVFLIFQKEIFDSPIYLLNKVDDENVYIVTGAEDGCSKYYRLVYDIGADFVTCSCRFFEFEGIPCRHMIQYFHVNQILHLPNQYILQRWTKNAKVGGDWDNLGFEMTDDPNKSLIQRRSQIYQYLSNIVDDASLSKERTNIFKGYLDQAAEKFKEMSLSEGNLGASVMENISLDVAINDPRKVREKGCGKRLKSSKEKAIDKGRKCHGCGLRNQSHDKRNCPVLLMRSNVNVGDDTSIESEQEDLTQISD